MRYQLEILTLKYLTLEKLNRKKKNSIYSYFIKKSFQTNINKKSTILQLMQVDKCIITLIKYSNKKI